MNKLVLFFLLFLIYACQDQSTKPINEVDISTQNNTSNPTSLIELPYPDSSFQTFESKEGDVTYFMKKYFIAFLKSGPKRDQPNEEATKIQNAHLAYLGKLYEEKRICMVGPFGNDSDSDIEGIVIFSVPDKEEAMRLAALDPAVQAGRLVIEIQPWWAAKGSELF